MVDVCTFALCVLRRIDEDTHLSQRSEDRRNGICTSRNVPSKSCNLDRIAPAFGSQEPRRPRFSFFHLHAVKELTPVPKGMASSEAGLPKNMRTKPCRRLPGSRSALSEIAEQWERNKSLDVVSGRVVVEAPRPVNTHLKFGISSEFQSFHRVLRYPFRGASVCSGAAYMGDFVNLSTPVCNKSVAHRFGRSRKASKFAAAASIANLLKDVISPRIARGPRWRTGGKRTLPSGPRGARNSVRGWDSRLGNQGSATALHDSET
jgi:hypothetical protein